MEDIILLDAIERYIKGELHPAELEHFEQLRVANPEIDQLVVEHRFFLRQIEQIGERKHFNTTLDNVHAELITNHDIKLEEAPVKVVSIFGKYKKHFAIAATVVTLFSLAAIGLYTAYRKSKVESDFQELKNKVDAVSQKVDNVTKEVKSRNNVIKPTVVASTTGTSFIINENGYLITNNHVVGSNKKVYVYNERFGDLEAEVILNDESNDLAIIKIMDTSFKAIKKLPYSIKNNDAGLGKGVYTLGYSRPPALIYNEGFVSSKYANGSLTNKENFLLTLRVDGGSSGSPIFNFNGEIIGIISAKEKMENGFAVGIKPSSISNIIGVMNNDIKTKTSLYNKSSLTGLGRDAQILKVQDYIFMVKVK